MRKDYEKLFTNLKPVEPSAGLFDKIILTIKREQGLQHTKRLIFGFVSLLLISFVAIPFSWTLLVGQVESSGIFYFISTAVNDFGTFLILWQNFSLAILESLPIMGIIAFTVNMALILFIVRLFLYRKRLLLAYPLTYERR